MMTGVVSAVEALLSQALATSNPREVREALDLLRQLQTASREVLEVIYARARAEFEDAHVREVRAETLLVNARAMAAFLDGNVDPDEEI